MPKLKFHAKTIQRYSGVDHGHNSLTFQVAAGEEFHVSDEKAKQLLTDYPQDFAHADRQPDLPPIELAKEEAIGASVAKSITPKKNKMVTAAKKMKRK